MRAQVELPSIGVQVRDNAFHRFEAMVRDIAPRLDEQSVRVLTTYAIAGADGLFIAKEVGCDSVDLIELLDLHARLVFAAAVKLLQSGEIGVTAYPTQLTDAAQLLYDAHRPVEPSC